MSAGSERPLQRSTFVTPAESGAVISVPRVAGGLVLRHDVELHFERRATNPGTNAVAEGLNSKIQLIKAGARGFRNFANFRVAILFE